MPSSLLFAHFLSFPSPYTPSPSKRLTRALYFTIIAPSSILLLAEGRTAYMGSTADALPYFERCSSFLTLLYFFLFNSILRSSDLFQLTLHSDAVCFELGGADIGWGGSWGGLGCHSSTPVL